MRSLQVLMIVSLCLAPACAVADDVWMSVMLDGQKVGKTHVTREVQGSQVVTTQVLDFRLNRLKTPMVMHTELSATESADGTPLWFSSKGGEATGSSQITAHRRDNGTFQIDSTVNGQGKVSLLAWPEGALLAEGQRLATVSHGFRAGTSYQVRVFEPMRQQVADLQVKVVGDEWVDLPDGEERLHHLKQALADGVGAQTTDVWVDDDGIVRRSISPLLAYRLEMAACDRACAEAPDEDVDILRASMVVSPRVLPASLRTAPMRYVVTVRGQRASPFMNTDEQQVTELGEGQYQIDASYAQPFVDEDRPNKGDITANPWVQSDAPEVKALAIKVVGNASNNLQRMRRLRAFLTDYIDSTSLDVDYASALDTLKSRRGDCTEHAVLLAALARSQGIPTRVVTGLVYVDRYGGLERVFIPHAWVQSWIEGHWVSFDSAQGRYDTTHIAMAAGDGDPWRFVDATRTLGSISMQRADPTTAVIDPKTRGLARPELSRGTMSTLAPPGGGTGH